MCTADGRDYFAHLTSEIFSFFFFSSPSVFFSTNYCKIEEINRFLLQGGLVMYINNCLYFVLFFVTSMTLKK